MLLFQCIPIVLVNPAFLDDEEEEEEKKIHTLTNIQCEK